MAKCIDISGKRYGRLIVLKRSDIVGNRGQIKWDCRCDCGNKHTVTGESLRHNKSKSCGCLKKGRPPNYSDNRERVLWNRLYSSTIRKRNKKKFYADTDITLDEFITISKKPCFFCGQRFQQSAKDNANGSVITETQIFFNGIDRLDSEKPYIKGNIVSCCKVCNFAKNTLTVIEFKNHIRKIYNHFCL